MTTTIYKDGRRYIEIDVPDSDGFRVELPAVKNHLFTLQEVYDGDPIYIQEITFSVDQIDKIIDGLLDSKNEYRKEYGYE